MIKKSLHGSGAGAGRQHGLRSSAIVRTRLISTGALLVAVAVAVAGGVSACGSSSTSRNAPPVPVDASFLRRLEPICAADYAGMVNLKKPGVSFPYPNFEVEHPDPGLLPQVGTFFAPNVPYWQRLPGQLTTLGEPATNAAAWDRLRSLELQASTTGIRQVHAALARDATTFTDTAHTISGIGRQLPAAEDAAGLPPKSPCRDSF